MKTSPVMKCIALGLIAIAAGLLLFPGKNTDIEKYQCYYLKKECPGDCRPANGEVKITFFGATMLLFDDGETQFLIDGFITRPSRLQVALTRIQTDEKLVEEALKRGGVNRPEAIFTAH